MHSKEIISDDPNALARRLALLGSATIVFDGCPAVGKTTLARDMAAQLSCEFVDVDDYLHRNRGTFLNAIRFDELQEKLRELRMRSSVILIATVCGREVAEHLGLSDAIFVYVQRNTSVGLPADMDEIDAEDDTSTTNNINDEDVPGLFLEVRVYHQEYRPRRNANFIYIRASD